MSEMPWFKFDTKAWLEGTRNLTPEQRGIYVDCLCIMYRTERPLPLCDKRMSHALEISVRLWKSVKQALLNAGKLIETADGYTNERVQFELDSRSTQRRVKSESAVKREREKREKRESANENNEPAPQLCENSALDRREERKEEEREEQNKQLALEQEAPRAEPERAAVALPSLDELEGKLTEACNGALANPAVAQGLHDLSTPIMWLKSGADLEADVIPVLRAIGKRDCGKGIASWNYFTKAVSAAKERREKGLPPAEVGGPQGKPPSAAFLALLRGEPVGGNA